MSDYEILQGDCLGLLKGLPADYIQTVVTSPPYWGLRDYGTGTWEGGNPECSHKLKKYSSIAKGEKSKGVDTANHSHQQEGWKGKVCGRCGAMKKDDQLGLEATLEEYVENLVKVFREIRRVIRPDGTLWLNLGDAYFGNGNGGGSIQSKGTTMGYRAVPKALKHKDLMGLPWRVAFVLQADGWYLRADIIWSKPNPMPESVTDRPTKAHEYIFLLSKEEKYYYNAEAIKEPAGTYDLRRPYGSPGANNLDPRGKQGEGKTRSKMPDGWDSKKGAHGSFHREGREKGKTTYIDQITRNKRSVWTVTPQPYSEAHFATFPEDLVKPCILAGSRSGDLVLDPFSGSGTTGLVATKLGRRFIGMELNPEYVEMSKRRINASTPGLAL